MSINVFLWRNAHVFSGKTLKSRQRYFLQKKNQLELEYLHHCLKQTKWNLLMSTDISRKIKNQGSRQKIEAEADKKIEKTLLLFKKLLNRFGTNLGDWIARVVIKATSYNIIPSILVSFIFSYIALSDDVKILVRRKIPLFMREAALGQFSLETITFFSCRCGVHSWCLAPLLKFS
ncbi:hypothetical protein M1B34_06785 [Pseudomonas sp. MAFF 302030]|uniref:Uncharacterized protein n=1 Tax=Pseudomonas morbosilactucae TaxID=2938197 RepID=A0A9X2C558_9PSED|nr:hypothetical protein [Pseudomonas morbosilactucae]MCK9797450.1 hypothetical protein [Pseudomonas morbosilactucae]